MALITLNYLFSSPPGYQDPEPRAVRVRGAGCGRRAPRDPPAHPAPLRGQERPLRLRQVEAGQITLKITLNSI